MVSYSVIWFCKNLIKLGRKIPSFCQVCLRLTRLSGDACPTQYRWFPLRSLLSGVQTPGSVWVERSDSVESPMFCVQSDVTLFCSVSLLGGKTKVSSSEPGGKNHIQGHLHRGVCVLWFVYMVDKVRTPAVALGSGFRTGSARTRPSCVFVFLLATRPHQISAVSVTVYPTI